MLSRTFSLLFFVSAILLADGLYAASSVDELPDLTGGVVPLLSYDPRDSQNSGGELFTGGRISSRGDIRFLVRLRNQSGDPIKADSLIVVVHKIQEMARLRDVTNKLDIPGADGHMEDGKPFFRVPVGGKSELEPYGESETVTIEIRNPDLLRLYPPVLRVRGVRRTASQDFQDALQTSIRREVRPPAETPQPLQKPPGTP